MTLGEHLTRVISAHRYTGPGCSCGYGGDHAPHLSLIVQDLLHGLETNRVLGLS